MAEITVLFSSAGRRVALIDAFRADAKALGMELRAICVDADPEWSAACDLADESFKVPPANSPVFPNAILKICAEENVKLVIPTIDPELLPYSEAREDFAKRGVYVPIGSPELIAIARDKIRTAEFARNKKLPAPRTAPVGELLKSSKGWRYPIVLKPISGSGSAHVQYTANEEDLALVARLRPDYIAQEHIEGREFTVHQYYDRAGKLRCSVPHFRKEVRAGEVSKAVTEQHPALMQLSEELAAVLPGPRGVICFQAIVREGKPFVFDINARFGGGFPLAHYAQATFPKWLMQEALNLPPSANNNWWPGATMLRYDSAVFSGGPIDYHQ